MFSKFFFLTTLFLVFGNASDSISMYHREYYETGKPKAEGWLSQGTKTGYWKFYHMNGVISEQGHYKKNKREDYWYFYDNRGKLEYEGHYTSGKKANWWLFYDKKGKVNHKCQMSNGKKNGYCLQYKNEKLTSAEKYKNGKKIKEWFSFRSFKRENKLSDLK